MCQSKFYPRYITYKGPLASAQQYFTGDPRQDSEFHPTSPSLQFHQHPLISLCLQLAINSSFPLFLKDFLGSP